MDPRSDHINKYNTLWNRLHIICSTATSTDECTLGFVFQIVFKSPEAKAGRLLHSLLELIINIIDNRQIIEGLSYEQVYNKMIDLKIHAAINSADNKAYKTLDVKGEGKEQRTECACNGPTALHKESSYCKMHYPTARSNAIPGISV